VLDLRDGKVATVTAFFTAQAFDQESAPVGYVAAVDFERFGLPIELKD
jgi:hypothetical protein